ncbi:hypothetical protein [Lacticaseibacillus daqingensis]|uniref:hypothetical protein n=1 Tax=Lacticaseibacillus daqingensis TaxID=2486014 RepID=UPI000F7B701F|nr:hypothetical protein [Lacticaseibacillus daqingensis]
MKKATILARSRRANLLGDERDRQVRAAADQMGHLIVWWGLLLVLLAGLIQQLRGATPWVTPWLPLALLSWDDCAQAVVRLRRAPGRVVGWPRIEAWSAGVMAVAGTVLCLISLLEAHGWTS